MGVSKDDVYSHTRSVSAPLEPGNHAHVTKQRVFQICCRTRATPLPAATIPDVSFPKYGFLRVLESSAKGRISRKPWARPPVNNYVTSSSGFVFHYCVIRYIDVLGKPSLQIPV